jgi:hypothetical protein
MAHDTSHTRTVVAPTAANTFRVHFAVSMTLSVLAQRYFAKVS